MTFLRSCNFVVTRVLRWGGRGAAMGVYCGCHAGILMGILPLLLFLIILVPSVFMLRVMPTASEIGVAIGLMLLGIILGGIAGFMVGLICGVLIGFMVYVLLSVIEWRHTFPEWCLENEKKLTFWACKGSVIGALSLCTSVPLVLLMLRQSFDVELITHLYLVGSLGGFAVALFLGARAIVREETARESSTR